MVWAGRGHRLIYLRPVGVLVEMWLSRPVIERDKETHESMPATQEHSGFLAIRSDALKPVASSVSITPCILTGQRQTIHLPSRGLGQNKRRAWFLTW